MLKEKRRRAGGAKLAAPPSTSGEAELEAEGAQDGVQAGQAGVATAGELAVEAFAVQAGEAGGTSHAALRFQHARGDLRCSQTCPTQLTPA